MNSDSTTQPRSEQNLVAAQDQKFLLFDFEKSSQAGSLIIGEQAQTASVLIDTQASDPQHTSTASGEDGAPTSDHEHYGEELGGRISQAMRSLVMDLSVDLPEWVIESLAVTYHGMMPLERFVAETLGWGTGVANIQHREDKSSCDATVDSSEEAAVDDAVEEAEGQGEGRFPMV